MNTIRMFAFAAAVLITAFFFRAIATAFTTEQPARTEMAAHGPTASGGAKSAPDRHSP